MDAKRLVVDVPTGLPIDGFLMGVVARPLDSPVFRADVTVTFAARKPSMTTKLGQEFCGLILVADIRAPHLILDHL